jgi:hypothetical protein
MPENSLLNRPWLQPRFFVLNYSLKFL